MKKRNLDGTFRDMGLGGKYSYRKLVRFPEPYGRWLADIDNPTEFIRQCVIEKFDTLMTAKLLIFNSDTIIDRTGNNLEATNQYIISSALNAIREAKLKGSHVVAISIQESVELGKTVDERKDEMCRLSNVACASDGQPLFNYIIFCSHCDKDGAVYWVLDCKRNVWMLEETDGLVRNQPNTGMLHLACYLVKSHPWRTLMIGNSSIDKKVSILAGIDFRDIEEWLRR